MQNIKITLGDELKLSITQHDTGEIETAFVHSTADHFEFKTLDVMPDNGDDVMRYQKPQDIAHSIERGLQFIRQQKRRAYFEALAKERTRQNKEPRK